MAKPGDSRRRLPPLPRSLLLRYGCAVVSVTFAIALRLALDPLLGNAVPFPPLLLAVLLTAWFGGLRPSCLAIVLSLVSADYFLLTPRGVFGSKGVAQYVGL